MINLREWLFRKWYWYVNTVDKNAEILFMNYGYSGSNENLVPDPCQEANRYSLMLYHILIKAVNCHKKDVVEIGCGRGGGLAYIASEFSPSSAIGIDIDKNATSFSKKHYKIANLSFQQGDAQNIPLNDESCDIVINVESSHRYQNMNLFISEVYRILRPEGYFLFADFRFFYEIENLQNQLSSQKFNLIRKEDITAEVIAALEKDDMRRRNLINKLVPKILHGFAHDFAGTVGSKTYLYFLNRRYVYMKYILQK